MMTILLIRHGIAAPPRLGQPDEARPLTEEGWTETRAAMGGLMQLGWKPTHLCVSPYRRAQETAACLQEVAGPLVSTLWAELVPEGSPAVVSTQLLALAAEGCPCVALVSHQPFCGELIYQLTGQSLHVGKASCHVMALKTGRYTLEASYTARQLRRASRRS